MRIIILLFTLYIFFSCKNNYRENKKGKKIFRYNEASGISSLDPAFANNLPNIRAVDQIFNGLVQLNDSLKVVPCIAKRWTISENGKKYTFYLRNDVFFHNDKCFKNVKNRKVTAKDFVYSFMRITDKKVASPGFWIFNNLKKSAENNFLGFKAVNDSVFEIFLKESFPPFLSMLSMQYCYVVPYEAIEFYGNNFRRHPVGTGPFMFKSWKEGVKLILVKNPNYFEKINGKRLPYIDGIAISFINDPEIAFLEFLKGNLDFISGIEGNYKNQILTADGNLKEKYKNDFVMIKTPYLNTEYLGFLLDQNFDIVNNSVIKNKYIRQAINYGIDRKSMIKYLRYNIGYPANAGFIPKGMPSYDENKVKGYYYDPDKARELLEKAGYPNGDGLPEITLHTTKQYLDVCEYIQHQLNEIGFKIKIEVNPTATHREMIALSKFLFFRKSWVADYPDAENYLALFYSKNFCPLGPNYTHFKNDKFDALYMQALKENNVERRYELYREMDRIIIKEAAVVPLYYDEVVRFVRKNIKNLGINSMNTLKIKTVIIK